MIDRREMVRRDLNPLYLPHFNTLCGYLSESVEWKPKEGDSVGIYTWGPSCGKRSFMSQDREYAKGRENVDGLWVVKAPRLVVTNAKGGESPHNYACATDWCLYDIDGVAHWPPADHPLWKRYVDAVTASGLRSGSEWGDGCHNELRITISWKTVHEVFLNYGPTAADAAIKAAMGPPVKVGPR